MNRMNRDHFNIETSPVEELMKEKAFEANKKLIEHNEEKQRRENRVKELTAEYDSMMSAYLKAEEEGEEELAEELMHSANNIVVQLNEIDPKVKSKFEKRVMSSHEGELKEEDVEADLVVNDMGTMSALGVGSQKELSKSAKKLDELLLEKDLIEESRKLTKKHLKKIDG